MIFERVGAADREQPQTTEEPFGAGLFEGPEITKNSDSSDKPKASRRRAAVPLVQSAKRRAALSGDEGKGGAVDLTSESGLGSAVPVVENFENRAAKDIDPPVEEGVPQEGDGQGTFRRGSVRHRAKRLSPGAPVRSTNRLRRVRRPASPPDTSAPSDGQEAEPGVDVSSPRVSPPSVPPDSVAGDTLHPKSGDSAGAESTGGSPGESTERETPAESKGRRLGGAKQRSKVLAERPSTAAAGKKPQKKASGRSEKLQKKASPTSDAAVSTRRKPRRRKGRGDAFSERSELLPAGAGVAPSTEEVDQDGATAQRTASQPGAPKPYHRILINADDSEEVRIAVLEEGQLEELHYERPNEKKYLGNIYKGRVTNIEPGIQAAFVDIGIGRNGFLHVSDVLPAYKDRSSIPIDSLSVRLADRRRLRIQDVLRKGQEILVQISKDAIGTKGPSLTTYVSLPGKYLVLMPGVSRHGVSKRIQGDDERSNLRDKLSQLNPPKGMGFIIRTAGQELFQADLEKDFQYLMKVWGEIYERVKEPSSALMIYAETDLVIRTLRDLSGPDVNEILIDDLAVYERAKKFLDEIIFEGGKRLKHYTGTAPIFSKFGVEEEIDQIYNRRVPLPNGGHIVLEQTEALVAIDVNSGKYRDEEDLESTALKTNLEAAHEIARQLRLRDLGGVIINDFIDMESEVNRRTVERALRMALKRDRAKSWITEISRFGIIEMTRQRVRPSFERANHESCKNCSGTGVVKSARSTGIAILRQIRAGVATKRRNLCEVLAPPAVVDYLLNERRHHLVELENNSRKTIIIKACGDCTRDRYSIKYR